MTIKKAAKASIITAAAVAAVGIGAVSFAAWNGGNNAASGEVAIGHVALIGFTDSNAALTFGENTKLVPYDQKNGIKNGTTFVSVELPEYEVSAAYTITVSFAAPDGVNDLAFYANIGTQITSAPENLTGWEKLNATFNYDAPAEDYKKVSGQYLNIVLDSTNKEHMNINDPIKFTVTLALAE